MPNEFNVWRVLRADKPPEPRRRKMGPYRFTHYFETEVLRKRPYIERAWRIAVVEHPIRMERQEDNRAKALA
jgi:hypothetical protein